VSQNRDIDRLIVALANGEDVDWAAARSRARSEADQVWIESLCGIAQIAAFSHAQWERFGPLLERALELEVSERESWLGGLDATDATDLRQILSMLSRRSP